MNTILIQGAEPSETNFLESKLENLETIIIGGFTFSKGKYGDKDIIISRTKVGEINSASATTIGILNFSPEAIINQGTAGGHGRNIHKGDFVIGEKYFQLNAFYSDFLEEGKSYSIDNWKFEEYKSSEDKDLEFYNKELYKCATKDLVELAKKELPKLVDSKVHCGIIGSGDVWNREVDRILYLNKEYKTLCEEMETAGVYKIANSFHVPVISIRIISNNEVLKENYEPEVAREMSKSNFKVC